MARPTPDAIYEPFRGAEQIERPCQHSDCTEPGLYRAPMSRDRLSDYYWFCLDHVRAYNLAWDYFVGMSEAEIEAQRRVDTVWERPTWRLGGNFKDAEARVKEEIEKEFGGSSHESDERRKPRSEDEKALAVLDLKRPVTFPEIKARYKELVKRLHPDANGGDTAAEDRLKHVNLAYSILKHSFVQ